jgi:hypothetical protein
MVIDLLLQMEINLRLRHFSAKSLTHVLHQMKARASAILRFEHEKVLPFI